MKAKAEPFGRAATYKDLCAVPADLIAEIIEGDLWVSPRPSLAHSHAAIQLTIEIGAPFGHGRGGPGGWWILFEPEIHLADDVVVPDLAGWKQDRLLRSASRAHMTQPPDWVCEILSPATEEIDRNQKLRIYARERVGHVWFIDPTARTVEVLRRAGNSYAEALALKGDAVAAAEPFEAVPFPLTRIWLDR